MSAPSCLKNSTRTPPDGSICVSRGDIDARYAGDYTERMDNELEQVKKRLAELSRRAQKRGEAAASDFLTPAEQAELTRLGLEPYVFDGGWEGAERRCAVFLPWEGCEWESRVVCLEIAPANVRFAEELTHRDYLGALMALGIRREAMGDILVRGKTAWLFCLDTVAEYVSAQLGEVRRTTVRVKTADPAAVEPPEPPKETVVNVSSPRLDALVAAVYRLSRAESQRLFERELVLVNSLPARGPGAEAKKDDIISVRGHGRFQYLGGAGETRKGRLKARVRVY